MSNPIKIDYLIVGQGIAGSVLAHKLLAKNKSIRIIDNKHKSSSSLIAGGVTHPMSFKRIILSWKADKLIPIAKAFYKGFEDSNNTKVFYELPMTRVFSSIEEQNNWHGRMADSPMKEVIEDSEIDLSSYPVKAPFGTGKVNLAGRLDLAEFLSASFSSFKEKEIISTEQFEYDQLIVGEDEIKYKNIEAKKIVFCEGYQFTKNPYFDYIPLSPTKGEILIIKTKELPQTILSQGCFVMPIGEDKYVLGATYDRENINQEKTTSGKEELIDKLKNIGHFDFEIVEQKAGVRPTTHDRRPIVGSHPKYNNVVIFNGLGSKGVMLAPNFASELIEHLENGTELDKEVQVGRYSKKHLHKCLM